MKLQTTLRIIRAAQPCADGYARLLRSLPKDQDHDTPISFAHILESNGLDDALWGLRCVLPAQEKERDREARLLACDYAEAVLPVFEKQYPDDKRPRVCIETARAFANGKATAKEMDAAMDAAWAAARAAWAAGAARAAAWAAGAARATAWAAGATAWVAGAARAAAMDAAGSAQTEQFKARFCQ